MGASTFITTVEGLHLDARRAFSQAIQEARHESGWGGYTGTIAEKSSYVMIGLLKGQDPYDYANRLIDEDDSRIRDKWGPAGCIHSVNEKTGHDKYVFFGWASD